METAILNVSDLPRQRHRDDWTVKHGYAVNLQWAGGNEWFFYGRFEAAWIFLRTARMGEYVEGGIYRAADEVRFQGDDITGSDHRTIYVGEQIDYWEIDESALLRHFITLVDQRSKFQAQGKSPADYPR